MRLIKTAMPCRLGEIDGITRPMPANLCDIAKNNYPSFCERKTMLLVESFPFLDFIFNHLGGDKESLHQIYSVFVLEDDGFCKIYLKI
jgi:hypothetical protein